jgi:hypothetical protein
MVALAVAMLPLSAWDGLVEGAVEALFEDPGVLTRCIRAAAHFRSGDSEAEDRAQDVMHRVQALVQTQRRRRRESARRCKWW